MRNKVALIVGLVLSVIVILGLVVLPIVFAIYGKRELIFLFFDHRAQTLDFLDWSWNIARGDVA